MFSTDPSPRRRRGCAVVALRGELDLADAVTGMAALTAVAAREPVIIADMEFSDLPTPGACRLPTPPAGRGAP